MSVPAGTARLITLQMSRVRLFVALWAATRSNRFRSSSPIEIFFGSPPIFPGGLSESESESEWICRSKSPAYRSNRLSCPSDSDSSSDKYTSGWSGSTPMGSLRTTGKFAAAYSNGAQNVHKMCTICAQNVHKLCTNCAQFVHKLCSDA